MPSSRLPSAPRWPFFVNTGASLATITSLSGILSPRVPGSFALLGLFALLPALYGRFKSKDMAD